MRRDVEYDLILVVRALFVAEEGAEDGDVSEQRKFRDRFGVDVREEAAEDDRLAVVKPQRRVDASIRDDRKGRAETRDL